MAQGADRRPVRHLAGQHPHPQPVPRRRLRLARAWSPARRSSASWRRKLVGRPVKLVLRREQMYGPVGHRSPTPPDDCASAPTRDGPLTAIDHHAKIATSTLRRFLRAGGGRLARALCKPRDRDLARGGAASTPARRCSCARPARRRDRSRSKARSTRWREACGMDPLAFRLKNYAEVEPITGKPFSSKALRECYAQGAERFGWSKRPLDAAPDARRGRLAGRLGHGHRDLSGADVPGRGARGDPPRRIGRRWRPARTTWARAPGRRSPRSRPMRSGSTSTQVEFKAGTSDLPDAGIAGGSAHTATAGMAIHNAGADVIAKLAELATGDRALAAVRRGQCRRDRARRPPAPPRRRKPQRELCRYPRPRRPRRDRRPRQRRGRPGRASELRHACAWRGVRRGQGRS